MLDFVVLGKFLFVVNFCLGLVNLIMRHSFGFVNLAVAILIYALLLNDFRDRERAGGV